MVSCGKGAGLQLAEQMPGKIILFAGGTGIYPFIDTIDALFKKSLCDQNHQMKNKILEMNPAVNDISFAKNQFSIYTSFNS